MTRSEQPRRSCLSVPGSSPRFLARAQILDADQVLLDLEDAVAPDAEHDARGHVITALTAGDWDGKVITVRVNGATTRWAYRDVIDEATRKLALVAAARGRAAGLTRTSWFQPPE
jgi:citrate lyase subunit beta / citryl-CoA lyase